MVEVVRALWDSWEDDAEIRDVATGRFIDRDKRAPRRLRGPLLLRARPLDHAAARRRASRWWPCSRTAPMPYELAARAADLVLVTPGGPGFPDAAAVLADVGRAVDAVGGRAEPLRVVRRPRRRPRRRPTNRRRERLRRLDATAPHRAATRPSFAGSAAELADLLLGWQALGFHGVRLRPAVLPDDLDRIVDDLVPELQRRGRFRTAYPEAGALRGLLGLPTHVPNRYATRLTDDRHEPQADHPRRLPRRREPPHRLVAPAGRQPDRLRLLRAHRPHRRARQVRLLLPRRGPRACASGPGRSSTRTSSAAPTRSPCWPRWPPSPTTSGWPARSTPPSTSPTSWPASSPRWTTSPDGRAAWNVVTSFDAFTGQNFRRGGFLDHSQRYERAQEMIEAVRDAVGLVGRRRPVADKASGRFLRRPDAGAFAHPRQPVRHHRPVPACRAARRATR